MKKTTTGLQFRIKVQPRSSKNEIVGLQGDALKIKLTAPPVDGEANEACVRFLSGFLKVPRQQVKIVSGQTSHYKIIEIEHFTEDELRNRLHGIL